MNTERQAQLSDLEALTELFEAYRLFYGMQPDPAGALNFLKMRLEKNESAIFISEENLVITGFVQLYPLFSSTRLKPLWLLNDLYVSETSRGQGISLLLIEAGKNLCRTSGAAGLMLETAKTNAIGNNLYPKAGFTMDLGHNYYFWNC